MIHGEEKVPPRRHQGKDAVAVRETQTPGIAGLIAKFHAYRNTYTHNDIIVDVKLQVSVARADATEAKNANRLLQEEVSTATASLQKVRSRAITASV